MCVCVCVWVYVGVCLCVGGWISTYGVQYNKELHVLCTSIHVACSQHNSTNHAA